jgi:16S rRNA G966 N2-methylase RsmD
MKEHSSFRVPSSKQQLELNALQYISHEIPISNVHISESMFRRKPLNVKSLANSISAMGLIHPVLVKQLSSGDSTIYQLLVGYRRFEACKLLGMKTITAIIVTEGKEVPYWSEFPNDNATSTEVKDPNIFKLLPFDYAVQIAENFERAHYTESEKAHLQKFLLAYFQQFSQQGFRTDLRRRRRRTFSKNLEEVDYHGCLGRVAKLCKESHETIRKRLKLFEMAALFPDSYSEIIRLMDQGTMSVHKGYLQMERIEARRKFIESLSTGPNTLPNDQQVLLLNNDFRNTPEQIRANSISMVITDPPYSEQFLPLYGELGSFSMRGLREGGSLIVYASQPYLDRVIELIKAQGLKYWWQISVVHAGRLCCVHARGVMVEHKVLLWFVKGKAPVRAPSYIKDLLRSKAPSKAFHVWEQSTIEASYIISHLTFEHATICDPMMGSGTTGVAALSSGRRFVGCEIDRKSFIIAKQRIASVL